MQEMRFTGSIGMHTIKSDGGQRNRENQSKEKSR